MVPVPEKVWVVGHQTFKVNCILHAGQGTRTVNPGLSQMFGTVGMYEFGTKNEDC